MDNPELEAGRAAYTAWGTWRQKGDRVGGPEWDSLKRAMDSLGRFQAVEACSWCHWFNPISTVLCRKCGHMAHVPRVSCMCEVCQANRARALEQRRVNEAGGG